MQSDLIAPVMEQTERERREFGRILLKAVNEYFKTIDTPQARERQVAISKIHASIKAEFVRTGKLPENISYPPDIVKGFLKEQKEVVIPATSLLWNTVNKAIEKYSRIACQKGYLYDRLLKNVYSGDRKPPFEAVKEAAKQLQMAGLPDLTEFIISETKHFVDSIEVFRNCDEDEYSRADAVQHSTDQIFLKAFKIGLCPTSLSV